MWECAGEGLDGQSAAWSEKLPMPPQKMLWLTCMARALRACHGAAQACWTHKLLMQGRAGQR